MRAVAFLISFLFAVSAALAGPRDDADAAIARGIALRRQGDDAAALDEFKRAKALSPSPRATAQVGLALQALGRWTEAEAEIDDALREAGDAWIGKNRATLEGALATIREHVGSVEVLGSPAGADIFIEQRRVGALPLTKPAHATAGAVALEVRAPGYLPIARNVLVRAGKLSRETVNLTPEAATAASSAAPLSAEATDSPPAKGKASGGDWRTPAAWATGVGAIVLLATGVTALVVRGSKNDELGRKLDVDHTCSRSGNAFSGADAAACVDLATAKDTWTGVAVGTLIGGGIAAVLSGVFIATRPNGTETAATAGADQSIGPRLAFVVDRRLTFIAADWRF